MIDKIRKKLGLAETEESTDEEATDEWRRYSEDELIGVWPRDGAWGHNIKWEDWEERRVSGHVTVNKGTSTPGLILDRPVEEGDLFGFEMASGKVGVFELVDVENMRDPRDMFFAEVRDVGYLEE